MKKLLLSLISIAFVSSSALAAAMEGKTGTTNKLTFGGDLRVRHESFFNKTRGQADRHRERFRLRFGVDAAMEKWDLGFGLASGTGEQTSTNQTMGGGFNQKNIYIDYAFATYKPLGWLKMDAGKIKNPFWRLYSSDLVWDSDLNPEGFAQRASTDLNDMISVFGNFAQLTVNEINSGSASDKDPWMFGNQVGVQTKIGGGVRWDFALANYSLMHERTNVLHATSTVDSSVIQGDNRRVAGSTLLNGQYNMMHLTTQLGFQALVPVRFQADYVKNIHDEKTNGQDMGYQWGFILNSAKNAGGWEFAYFNKYSEAHATLSDFADSDWGNGGTNRKGHIIWLGYSPTDFLTFQGKYFMTKRVDPFIGASAPYNVTTTHTPRDINRFQLDMVVKF